MTNYFEQTNDFRTDDGLLSPRTIATRFWGRTVEAMPLESSIADYDLRRLCDEIATQLDNEGFRTWSQFAAKKHVVKALKDWASNTGALPQTTMKNESGTMQVALDDVQYMNLGNDSSARFTGTFKKSDGDNGLVTWAVDDYAIMRRSTVSNLVSDMRHMGAKQSETKTADGKLDTRTYNVPGAGQRPAMTIMVNFRGFGFGKNGIQRIA